MAKQNIEIIRDNFQNEILELEKKYMGIIYAIIDSDDFINDLLAIEKEVKHNYGDYSEKFSTVDKINIMAERLITHHVYMKLYNNITSIYPSPVSSDIGVRMNDCILCIDAKTINVVSNKVDVSSTQIEQNQNSFDNKNYLGIHIKSNLKTVDYYHEKELPVLSYIVKIIYSDDKHSFKLNKDDDTPSIVVACIPNGKLSNLFDYNIIQNFKTYDYYTENDNPIYAPIYFPSNISDEQLEIFIKKETNLRNLVETNYNGKRVFINVLTQVVWWETSNNNKKCLRAVKSGSNMRVYNSMLEERYDSTNNSWSGYKCIYLKK